jgi:hypothetical protein
LSTFKQWNKKKQKNVTVMQPLITKNSLLCVIYQVMTKIYLLVMGLISFNSFAQNNNAQTHTKVTESTIDLGFEDFVNKNAVSIISPSNKVMGKLETIELTSLENITLKDIKLTALEEKAQYFSIKGTDKILKIESLYRLKLMYQSKK